MVQLFDFCHSVLEVIPDVVFMSADNMYHFTYTTPTITSLPFLLAQNSNGILFDLLLLMQCTKLCFLVERYEWYIKNLYVVP